MSDQKQQTPTLTDEQLATVAKIVLKNSQLGVSAEFHPPVKEGTRVSLYKFLPKGATRVAHMEAVAPDLALALGIDKDTDLLIQRLAGEPYVGIYVPNAVKRQTSLTQSLTATWQACAAAQAKGEPIHVPINFGTDWLGNAYVEDLTKSLHLLVAGSTGGGKSVWGRAVLTNLITNKSPDEVHLVLSDTKQVELDDFAGIPHMHYGKIAKSVYESLEQLEGIIDECEQRMKTLAGACVRNLVDYNHENPRTRMPFLVVYIDELADLLLFKGNKRGESHLAEEKISKIVAKTRAAGAYLIASTQRPSVDVVTGIIKANFPARLSFKMPSGIDSRTILATEGAEHLSKVGDMLYKSPLRSDIVRLHAPFARAKEIEESILYATNYRHEQRQLR